MPLNLLEKSRGKKDRVRIELTTHRFAAENSTTELPILKPDKIISSHLLKHRCSSLSSAIPAYSQPIPSSVSTFF